MSETQKVISLATRALGSRANRSSGKTSPAPYVSQPLDVDANYSEGILDVTACDAPKRQWLALSILKMNAVGLVSNAVLAAMAHSVLAQPAEKLGLMVEGWGYELGRNPMMTGMNAQGFAWMVFTAIVMLVNVGVVFHLVHDTALHYRFRAWACRLMARLVTSLNVIGGENVKAWAREMLDRSRMDRLIGFTLMIFMGVPLFVLGATLPWVVALAALGNPPFATTVTAIALALVLLPTTIELLRIAQHIRNADASE